MLRLLESYEFEKEMIERYIKDNAAKNGALNILEAGCGQNWGLNLQGIKYHLTGVDVDRAALEIRKFETKDLDEIIEGDLCTVKLQDNHYDVIYNSYVLEHISGAETVMKNFQRWLKPGGIIIVRFPDRQSAYGFMTRHTPFWFHVFFKKVMMGDPNAGKPGFAPYRVFYDRIVSQKGMNAFCSKHNLSIKEEWGHPYPMYWDSHPGLLKFACRTVSLLSLGTLGHAHNNLTYIIQKNP
jgi:SAM-dependent methyltransferase